MSIERYILVTIVQQLHLGCLPTEGSLYREWAGLRIKIVGSFSFEHEVGLYEWTRRNDLTYMNIRTGERGGKVTLSIHRGMSFYCAHIGCY